MYSLTSKWLRYHRSPAGSNIIKSLHRRSIHSTTAALELLNLTNKPNYTQLELRDAYFNAAKRCHPDSTFQKQSDDVNVYDLTSQFMQLTDAYEYLQKQNNEPFDEDDHEIKISDNEEQIYRENCLEVLGLQAEVVEESKRCPLFRDWLRGNTDAALHWKIFFMLNGGLAPKLNPVSNLIGAGKEKKIARRQQYQRRSM